MIHQNRNLGTMLFASSIQINAIRNCHIIIADATFELSPKPFKQIWTLHGLFEFGNRAEWVPLGFGLMERKWE